MMLRSLFQAYFTDHSIGFIAHSLVRGMNGPGLEGELWVCTHERGFSSPVVRPAIPTLPGNLLFKTDWGVKLGMAWTRRRYIQALQEGDLAYLWPNVPLSVFIEAKKKGAWIATDGINCHQAYSRAILKKEFSRLGLQPSKIITDEDILEERRKLELTDILFAPSPLVAESFEKEGFPAERILRTSYGWDPARLEGEGRALPPGDGLDVLFTGRIGVRKGAHLLFRIWEEAGIKGRLLLAGRFFDGIEKEFASFLDRPDVVVLGFIRDIGTVFRSAQVMAFPSLEEGSPLVTYEAMSQGLAMLVSPMGSGGVVRHEKEGLVLDPHDHEAWVRALRRLAEDRPWREAMGRAAKERAKEFTWEKVARRRREAVLQAMGRLEKKKVQDPGRRS